VLIAILAGFAPLQRRPPGFVLAEGAGAVVLAAEEVMEVHGLEPKAEVLGIGWTSMLIITRVPIR